MMTENTQPLDPKETPAAPKSEEAVASDPGKVQESVEEPKSEQAGSEGPRKILDALDKQAENTAAVSADQGGSISASPEVQEDKQQMDSVSDGTTPAAPVSADASAGKIPEVLVDDLSSPSAPEMADKGSDSDTPAVFSSGQGPMGPDLMISDAMKKLDKILEDIKAGTCCSEEDSPGESDQGQNENQPLDDETG